MRQVEPDDKNFPGDYSADYQRFEPMQTVYVSISAVDIYLDGKPVKTAKFEVKSSR